MPKTTLLRAAKAALIGLGVIGTVGAAFTASSSLAAINSNLYIEARKTFVLGGEQDGAFRVRGQNKGEVTVEVFASESGENTLVATAKPGDRFEAYFESGEGALLRNTSATAQAYVKVRVTGSTSNLGMSYEGW
jgi:hypothetical protein